MEIEYSYDAKRELTNDLEYRRIITSCKFPSYYRLSRESGRVYFTRKSFLSLFANGSIYYSLENKWLVCVLSTLDDAKEIANILGCNIYVQ